MTVINVVYFDPIQDSDAISEAMPLNGTFNMVVGHSITVEIHWTPVERIGVETDG